MRCVEERLVADVTILDLAGPGRLGEINTEITDRVRARIGERRSKCLGRSAQQLPLNVATVARFPIDRHLGRRYSPARRAAAVLRERFMSWPNRPPKTA
jgi:hypothetical protein